MVNTNTSKWKEIRNDYIEESEEGFHVLHIDSWRTDDDNEEGVVIAKLIGIIKDGTPCVYLTYNDLDAMSDPYASDVIQKSDQFLRNYFVKLVDQNSDPINFLKQSKR